MLTQLQTLKLPKSGLLQLNESDRERINLKQRTCKVGAVVADFGVVVAEDFEQAQVNRFCLVVSIVLIFFLNAQQTVEGD